LVTPLVTEWFGAPKQKVQAIDLLDPEAAAFESGNLLLTPLAKLDSRLYELTAVHELTHAAFPSPRPWIYEGLAHFAQALDREQHNDRQGALDFMAPFRASIVDAEKSASVSHSQNAAERSLINTSAEDFYRSKAMFVWWMLRDMIGDDALKKALATYKPDQDKEPSYFQRLIETQSKRDLQWFFDDWVYADRGLPDFRVESAYAHAGVGGGYFISVTVENLGNTGAEVPLTIKTQAGQVTKRLEVRAKSKASIRIDVPSKPEEIVINDGSVPESDMSNNTYKISLTAK
jgi:aminopeptidase N